MSTDKTLQINSSSSDNTESVAERLGQNCRGGEVFLLASDLGGGKTTFTKGLAKGLGSSDVVSSPTFTVSKVYNARGGINIYHFDFYRLTEGGMVAHELAEYLGDPRAVVVVEWGDVVSDDLPDDRITVLIERTKEGEDHRNLNITVPSDRDYLLESI